MVCRFYSGERQSLSPRKNIASPSPCAALACVSCASLRGQSAAHVAFRGLPINKKCGPAALRREPAHHVCRTCSKKRRLPAQENTRRHARLSRTCFGRNRRPAFTTALFPFSFFTKEKKKENRSKFSRFKYIARTHFVRPHDVRDWPAAPRLLKFM